MGFTLSPNTHTIPPTHTHPTHRPLLTFTKSKHFYVIKIRIKESVLAFTNCQGKLGWCAKLPPMEPPSLARLFVLALICFWPLGGSAARRPTSSHPETGPFLLRPTRIQLGRSGRPLSQENAEKLSSHHGRWLWPHCCPRSLAGCTGKTGSGMWPSLLVRSTGQG